MIKSLKDKIATMASDEILGEASGPEEQKQKAIKEPKKEKVKKVKRIRQKKEKARREKPVINKVEAEEPKVKKPKKEKSTKERRQLLKRIKDKVEREEFEDTNEIIEEIIEEKIDDEVVNTNKLHSQFNKEIIDGYDDVLSILGIKETIELDLDFTSEDCDNIEFTQTQPIGFDFDEVTDFISRVKYIMYKLESALKERDIDIIKVASEVKRVEQKMIEQNQQKELDRMIGGMTEEERLIQENMELKVQINDLRRELKSNPELDDKIRQIEALKAENEMLKSESLNREFNKNNFNKLPSFDNNQKTIDPFQEMLSDIGGLYEDDDI